jgi:hypothetical protein
VDHVATNILIELDDDAADMESMITNYLVGPREGTSAMLVRNIRYSDRVPRVHEAWRIAQRRHQFRWMFETSPTSVS